MAEPARTDTGRSLAPSENRYRVTFLAPETKALIRKYAFTAGSYLAGVGLYPLEPSIRRIAAVRRPIFVIGCSRSGTTLFIDMFARHRDLANLSEAPELFEPRYWNPGIDHVKGAAEATPWEARRIRGVVALYTLLRRRSRFVNKHVDNSLRIGFLKAIFPDALFIHMYRDGRAVIRSNYAQTLEDRFRRSVPFGFFPKPPSWRAYRDKPLVVQFAHQWVDIVEHIREQAAALLDASSYLEVPYERFCADAHDVLQEIDEFCGLDWNGRDYDSIPRTFSSQNRKWSEDLTAQEIHEVEGVAGGMLQKLGYA
jgi:hypothetical protein